MAIGAPFSRNEIPLGWGKESFHSLQQYRYLVNTLKRRIRFMFHRCLILTLVLIFSMPFITFAEAGFRIVRKPKKPMLFC